MPSITTIILGILISLGAAAEEPFKFTVQGESIKVEFEGRSRPVFLPNGVWVKKQIKATDEDAWIFLLIRKERIANTVFGLMTAKKENSKWHIEFPLVDPALSEILDKTSWLTELGDAKSLRHVYLMVSTNRDDGSGLLRFHWQLWNLETRKLTKVVEPTEPFKARINQ